MQIASAPLDLHSLTKQHQKHFLEMSYATLRHIQFRRHWVFTPWKSFLFYHASVRWSALEVAAKVQYFANHNILPFGCVANVFINDCHFLSVANPCTCIWDWS
jgi:hypothetical protein